MTHPDSSQHCSVLSSSYSRHSRRFSLSHFPQNRIPLQLVPTTGAGVPAAVPAVYPVVVGVDTPTGTGAAGSVVTAAVNVAMTGGTTPAE